MSTASRPVPLVGRGSELRFLGGLLDRVRDGGGGAVVVRGEAGVGKSALLSEAARSPARRLTNPITRWRDQPHHRYAGTDGRGTDQMLDTNRLTLMRVRLPAVRGRPAASGRS